MNAKKYIFLYFFIIFAIKNNAQSTLFFGGERFLDAIFEVEVLENIKYGENLTYKGEKQELFLDFYQPKKDTLNKRPLIILAYPGAFLAGSKKNGLMRTLAIQFAKFGYTVASIDYRRGYGKEKNEQARGKATVLRATQDMKAAVRFFRKDAETENKFCINPTFIVVGGSSAGALLALQAAYLKDTVDFACFDYNALGGFEGKSGNEEYSSKVQGVISLSGVIGDTAWIGKGDAPLLIMHGDQDYFVPFRQGKIEMKVGFFISFFIPKVPEVETFGALPISIRAKNVGLDYVFHIFENKGHCPFDKFMYPKTYSKEEDIVINYMRNFLYNQYKNPEIKQFRTDIGYMNKVFVHEIKKGEDITIELPDKYLRSIKVIIRDGNNKKKYVEKKLKSENGVFILKNNLKSGKYILKIQWEEFRKRIYFEI